MRGRGATLAPWLGAHSLLACSLLLQIFSLNAEERECGIGRGGKWGLTYLSVEKNGDRGACALVVPPPSLLCVFELSRITQSRQNKIR